MLTEQEHMNNAQILIPVCALAGWTGLALPLIPIRRIGKVLHSLAAFTSRTLALPTLWGATARDIIAAA